MAKDPAFLFYAQDFLTGVMFMSDEEVGKYIRLLCAQHQQGGMINKTAFNSIVKDSELLRSKFIEADEGFYNERLMIEMDKRTVKSNNLSANAKQRWEKEKQKKSKCNAIASSLQMPIENENENEIVIKDVIKTKKDNKMTESHFEKFWDIYPNKVNKKKAKEKFMKLEVDLFESIMYALEWQTQSISWKNGYIPNPETYIYNEKWNDKPKPIVNNNWNDKVISVDEEVALMNSAI